MCEHDQDKSRGLPIWHVEDYLYLLRRKSSGYEHWCKQALNGVDYLPYENVLPRESQFRAEYDALPNIGSFTLTGELLKEAQSWGLPKAWRDKRTFVQRCREKRSDDDAILAHELYLLNAIEHLRNRLYKEMIEHNGNCQKTILAFVAQNKEDVSIDFDRLIEAQGDATRLFLPWVHLDEPQVTPAPGTSVCPSPQMSKDDEVLASDGVDDGGLFSGLPDLSEG